jgi:protein phosphatase
MGKISVEESRNHKLKHVITKYLGSPDFNIPTIQKINWNNNDMLILCTDGLTNVLEDKEIESVINRLVGSELDTKKLENSKKRNRSQEICDTLVDLTNQTGGYDNITVITLENKIILHKTSNVTD